MPNIAVVTSQKVVPVAPRRILPPSKPRVKADALRPPEAARNQHFRLKVGAKVDRKA